MDSRKTELLVVVSEDKYCPIWQNYIDQVKDGIITEEELQEKIRFEVQDALETYGFNVNVKIKGEQLSLFS